MQDVDQVVEVVEKAGISSEWLAQATGVIKDELSDASGRLSRTNAVGRGPATKLEEASSSLARRSLASRIHLFPARGFIDQEDP